MILPYIECDFNARGWSGDLDDMCFYVFVIPTDISVVLHNGLRSFIFMYDNAEKTEIVGCEAVFEQYHEGWRARPDETTWYNGERLW